MTGKSINFIFEDSFSNIPESLQNWSVTSTATQVTLIYNICYDKPRLEFLDICIYIMRPAYHTTISKIQKDIKYPVFMCNLQATHHGQHGIM